MELQKFFQKGFVKTLGLFIRSLVAFAKNNRTRLLKIKMLDIKFCASFVNISFWLFVYQLINIFKEPQKPTTTPWSMRQRGTTMSELKFCSNTATDSSRKTTLPTHWRKSSSSRYKTFLTRCHGHIIEFVVQFWRSETQVWIFQNIKTVSFWWHK